MKKNKNKVIKLKTNFDSKNLMKTSKLRALLVVTVFLFSALIIRIGFIQFVE